MLRRILPVAAWLRGGWWRMRRPVNVGVRVAVFDDRGRVLLVRHSYGASWWYLPGGGVKRRESMAGAAARELREEAGIEVRGGADVLRLHGAFTNLRRFSTDHIAVYVVSADEWTPHAAASIEIAACEFFSPDALPAETSPGTRRRIQELAGSEPPPHAW